MLRGAILAAGLLPAWAALALLATPWLMARLLVPDQPAVGPAAGLACAGLALVCAWIARERLAAALAALAARLPGPAGLIALGLLLRAALALALPPQPSSDGVFYLRLANQLAAGEPYVVDGLRAFWPPGYPLLLQPGIWLLGSAEAAVLPTNLLAYLLAALGLARLAAMAGGAGAARLALLGFALWPNLLPVAGTPDKEQLVIAALVWSSGWVWRSLTQPQAALRRVCAAGLCLGVGALIQPSLLLWPALVLVAHLLLLGPRPALLRTALFALAMAVAIAPWTVRNAVVLDAFVPIASNGGGNLYRANNPLATGGYTLRGEVDLAGLPELEADRRGRALAKDWITRHPGSFVALAGEKMLRFMGDDAAGYYSAFKLGGGDLAQRLYAPAKLAANLWWLGAWLLLAALALRRPRLAPAQDAALLLGLLAWGYLFALHAVFESAGKYHMPLSWVPPLLWGLLSAAPVPAAIPAHRRPPRPGPAALS